MATLNAREIAALVGGRVIGDASVAVSGVAAPDSATSTDLIFIDSPRRASALDTTAAAVALVPTGTGTSRGVVLVEVGRPALAMAIAIDAIVPPVRSCRGISDRASVAASATVADDVGIGPFAAVDEDAQIGRGTEIHAGATVGARTRIGAGCVVHAGVHVYPDVVIGDRVIL